MLKLMRVTTSGPFGTVRHWRHDRLAEAVIEIITIPGRNGAADIIRAGHLAKVTSQRQKVGAASVPRRRPMGDKPKPAA
jgi:hypothetical protein